MTAAARVRRLAGGAVLCGLAAGIRVQTVMLTAPLLLAVLLWPRTGLSFRDRAIALAAAALGVAAWGLPLLAASGGLGGYLAALGTQAGEDFSGVVMLWTVRQARVAADAVLNTFIWPWKELWLGAVVMVAAALGAVRLAWRLPARCALLLIAFAPYTVFHLLFHETATMRYALPIVPAVAFLAIYATAGLGRVAMMATAAAFVFVSLARDRTGGPGLRTRRQPGVPGLRGDRRAIATPPRRCSRCMRPCGGSRSGQAPARKATVLRAPHGHEWLGLVELWRREPDSDARFLADPRRTDLALLDPQARTRVAAERWTLPEIPFIAGTRPGAADAYTMRPPGWMLDRGWALSAEVGGITAKDGLGPHVQPSVAWIRNRPGAAELIVGGRHLGPSSDPPARLTLENERGPIDSWEVAPGFFFRRIALPAGTLDGTGYVPLRVSSSAADGSGRMVRVALEQFDLQPDGTVMFGFMDGWQEPEYSPATSRAWRWMSEQARLWVRPVGRDVVLTISRRVAAEVFRHRAERTCHRRRHRGRPVHARRPTSRSAS